VGRPRASIRAGADEPPGQFVHVDDVASAVVLAHRQRLDGPFNVAPDGWIPGEQVRALGGAPRLRLPERLTTRLAGLRWRLGLAPTPPGAIPLTIHPWVIANDRLRAAGWEPEHTNEEAYVAGHAPRPWERLSPRRRQEVALAAAAAGLAGIAVGTVVLVRRLRRRARDA
jgi:nucleoside-diphosphate-sugar epimerase